MSSFEKAKAAGLLVDVREDGREPEQWARARSWDERLLVERAAQRRREAQARAQDRGAA